MIYESADKRWFTHPSVKQHEITLDEGEQIIGVVSYNDGTDACHGDLQFIVGSI